MGAFQIIVTSAAIVVYFFTEVPLVIAANWRKFLAKRSGDHPLLFRLLPGLRQPLHPVRVLLNHGPAGLSKWRDGFNDFADPQAEAEEQELGVAAATPFTHPTPRLVPLSASFLLHSLQFCFLLTDFYSLYLFTYLLFAYLGTAYSAFFFSAHLLDAVLRLEGLRFILKAVLRRLPKLCATGLLVSFLVYLYAVIGFNAFRDMYEIDTRLNPSEFVCDDLYRCFFYTLNTGIRAFGGVGDGLVSPSFFQEQKTYFGRLFFDLTFFLFVTLFLVHGVVYGLITDSLVELRQQGESRRRDETGVCFVCGLTKHDFECKGLNFRAHTAQQHHLWDYVDLAVYLETKDPCEMSGVEASLWRNIAAGDTTWLPNGQALALPKAVPSP